jgi:hypothetical protein
MASLGVSLGNNVASSIAYLKEAKHDRLVQASNKEPCHLVSSILLLVFIAPVRYKVIKITCSCSDVVLQTMKNYKSHYSLSWFRPQV